MAIVVRAWSRIFAATPYVLFVTTLLAGLLICREAAAQAMTAVPGRVETVGASHA